MLKNPPPSGEILMKRAYPQRSAEREGKYDEVYALRNDQAVHWAASAKVDYTNP
jgi:hypothetical protein